MGMLKEFQTSGFHPPLSTLLQVSKLQPDSRANKPQVETDVAAVAQLIHKCHVWIEYCKKGETVHICRCQFHPKIWHCDPPWCFGWSHPPAGRLTTAALRLAHGPWEKGAGVQGPRGLFEPASGAASQSEWLCLARHWLPYKHILSWTIMPVVFYFKPP